MISKRVNLLLLVILLCWYGASFPIGAHAQSGIAAPEVEKYDDAVKHKSSLHKKFALELLRNVIGTPQMQASYNADEEYYTFDITSSHMQGYHLLGKIRVPLANAKKIKSELAIAQPNVVFTIRDGMLLPLGIVVQLNSSVLTFKDLTQEGASVTFDEQTARIYRAEQERQKKEELRISAIKRIEEETQERERAKEEAEIQARERATWPDGVVGKIEGGAFLCGSFKSAMKAQILRRTNNPYVSLPFDCAELPDTRYIIYTESVGNGLAKVQIYGAKRSGYASSDDVYY